MTGYKVSIHVATLEEAQAAQELALDAFGFPVTVTAVTRETAQKPSKDWRMGQIILEYMIKDRQRTYTYEDLQIVLEENKYKATSIYPLMRELVREGCVKWITQGLFRVAEGFYEAPKG